MTKYFDVAGYKKLKDLEKNNKIPLSEEKDRQLSNSVISLSDQIHYNDKTNYNSLIHKYIINEICPHEFRMKFLEIYKQNSKKVDILLRDFQKLENLILFPGSGKFGELVSDISMLCIEFDIIPIGYESNTMSETEFYLLVKSYSSEFLQEQLVDRSFKFLLITVGFGLLLLLSSIF